MKRRDRSFRAVTPDVGGAMQLFGVTREQVACQFARNAETMVRMAAECRAAVSAGKRYYRGYEATERTAATMEQQAALYRAAGGA